MTDSLTRARRLVGLGFSVIPLDHPDDSIANNPEQRGKVPAVKWAPFQKTPPTDDNLIAWFGNGHKRNVGIVCGAVSRVVLVDTDSPEAEEWASANLPATPFVSITAKGRHRFYRHPGGNVPPKVRVRDGVDLRGDGSYAVAPGSRHHTGIVYRAPDPWPDSFDVAPVFSMAWFGETQPVTAISTGSQPVPLIPAGQRNARLTSIAGAMRRAGLGAEEITAALMLHNGKHCSPPLSESEIQTIARSVGRYEPRDSSETIKPALEFHTFRDLARAVDAEGPRKFMLRSLWASGDYGVHAMERKGQKTWNQTDLSVSVASGTPWLGYVPTDDPGPVLMFIGEGGKPTSSGVYEPSQKRAASTRTTSRSSSARVLHT